MHQNTTWKGYPSTRSIDMKQLTAKQSNWNFFRATQQNAVTSSPGTLEFTLSAAAPLCPWTSNYNLQLLRADGQKFNIIQICWEFFLFPVITILFQIIFTNIRGWPKIQYNWISWILSIYVENLFCFLWQQTKKQTKLLQLDFIIVVLYTRVGPKPKESDIVLDHQYL